MKVVKVKVKATDEIKNAVYSYNSRGNLRYWIDGKFYSDKKLDSLFIIISSDL